MEIDGIKLDENNQEFLYAVEFIKSTKHNVFLTGKAGTGKTTFLKYIKQNIKKNVIVLAPTGVAAINAGGNTIHSFFQIRPSVYVPNDPRLRIKPSSEDEDKSTIFNHFQYNGEKLKIIRNLDLIIIDEISMVRCDLLDVIDKLLRVFGKKKSYLPFGGVQVLLIGDTFQLPPIANQEEWEILERFYESPFFFNSKIIEQLIFEKNLQYIELKKIYRQNDQKFIDLLNRVRTNDVTDQDLLELNNKYNPRFDPDVKANYITLATHNRIVNEINERKLNVLEGELYSFEANVEGVFPENIYPTDFKLNLKINSQVMFIKNDVGSDKRYYNGKIGKIISIEDDKIFIDVSEEKDIELKKYTWQNIRYKWNEKLKKVEEEVIGSFTQYAIKLAWAITVHKSQGLTFEKVIADLGAAWDSGQVYVALSRCTSLNGLVLKSYIRRNNIKTSIKALEFAENETPSTLLNKKLEESKADFYYKKSFLEIRKGNYESGFELFLRAFKLKSEIESNDFKRLVFCYLDRFKLKENIIKIKEKQSIEYIDNLTSLDSAYFELKMEHESLVKENKELNTNLKRLRTFDKKHKNEKLNLEEKLKIYKNTIQTKTVENETLKGLLREKEAEAERFKNLKWFQRIGKS